MEDLQDIAQFRSARFVPFLPDDSQVNPGVYGAELAFWLCEALARRGVVTSYPEYEDWGWYIEYSADSGAEFAVHCGNVHGEPNQWLLSLRRFGRKLFGRDKPSFSHAEPLVARIREVLAEEPSISELEWLYPEQVAG
jgi:hypothetical protein